MNRWTIEKQIDRSLAERFRETVKTAGVYKVRLHDFRSAVFVWFAGFPFFRLDREVESDNNALCENSRQTR